MSNKRAGRIIKHQKTRVIQTGKDYKGENSPYWEWTTFRSYYDHDGDAIEPSQANPDVLSTDDPQLFTPPDKISVGEVSSLLSGQQKKVFELYVQEGKSEKEIAKILGIGPATVRTYLSRVRERFQLYI